MKTQRQTKNSKKTWRNSYPHKRRPEEDSSTIEIIMKEEEDMTTETSIKGQDMTTR